MRNDFQASYRGHLLGQLHWRKSRMLYLAARMSRTCMKGRRATTGLPRVTRLTPRKGSGRLGRRHPGKPPPRKWQKEGCVWQHRCQWHVWWGNGRGNYRTTRLTPRKGNGCWVRRHLGYHNLRKHRRLYLSAWMSRTCMTGRQATTGPPSVTTQGWHQEGGVAFGGRVITSKKAPKVVLGSDIAYIRYWNSKKREFEMKQAKKEPLW